MEPMEGAVERDLVAEMQRHFAQARAEMEAHFEHQYAERLAAATRDLREEARRAAQPPPPPQPFLGSRVRPATPPTFTGRANQLLDWLFKLELYLAAVGIAQGTADAVTLAVGYLDGAALTWWRYRVEQVRAGHQRAVQSWEEFKTVVTSQFRTMDEARLARDRLRGLRQLGSVRDYAQRFQTLLLDLPTMHEDDRVWAFCAGLKPNVRVLVELARPKDLLTAIQVADTSDSTLYINRTTRAVRASDNGPSSMELGALNAARPGLRPARFNGAPRRATTAGPRDMTRTRCYACGKLGHLARACPARGQSGNV